MRVLNFVVSLLLVCLCAGFAFGQEALRVSPSTLNPSDESFLTIYASGIVDTDVVAITYGGPDGEATVEPSAYERNQEGQIVGIIAWVPMAITAIEGRYSVDVYVTRGSETFHFGPGHFNVAFPPPPEEPPLLLTLPEVVIGEASTPEGAIVQYSVRSSDLTPVNCSPLSGTWFEIGPTVVNCTANNGTQQAQGEFIVFVQDTTAPVLTLPDDISSDTPVVTWSATAVDAIDPSPTVVCSPGSGSTFAPGVTTVECYAFDYHQNYAFGSFDVIISGGAPVLTVPGNMVVEATSPDGAVVTFTATATENGVIVCTPPSGSTFEIGTTTVSCTATNNAGSDTEVFQVWVRDTTAPVIVNVNATPNAIWPPDHKMVPVTVSVAAFDAADPTPVITILSISSNQPVNGDGDGNTSPDWEITGPLTANVRAERSGNQDRIYTITVQATDESGNTSTATVEVRVTQSRRRGR